MAWVLAAAALALAGCTAGNDPPLPLPAEGSPERAFEELWQASLEVLEDYGFTIERQDRWAGLITTEPMTGKSVGEFWRRDAATCNDTWESTLQTIFHAAEVHIHRRGQADYYPEVRVAVSRSDRPDPQILSDAEAHAMFRQSPQRRQRSALNAGPDAQMTRPVPLGYDTALADQIAGEILAAAKDESQRTPRTATENTEKD